MEMKIDEKEKVEVEGEEDVLLGASAGRQADLPALLDIRLMRKPIVMHNSQL